MKKVLLTLFMAAAILFSGSSLFLNGGLVGAASARGRDHRVCCNNYGNHWGNWNRCHRVRVWTGNWNRVNCNWNRNWNWNNWDNDWHQNRCCR